jgi:pyruvate kinase
MMLVRSVAAAGTRRAATTAASSRVASSSFRAGPTPAWNPHGGTRASLSTTSFDFVTAISSSDGSASTTSARNLPLTKIVATIGPTSEQREPLFKVVKAGMTVMRLNFSHATREEVELRCENLALAQDDLSQNSAVLQNCRSVLLDTKGPEIRTGTLANDHSGHETIALPQGHRITLRTDPKVRDEGSTATDLYVDYPGLHRCLKAGSHVLLDDGAVVLVVEKDPDPSTFHGKVECVVQHTGSIRSRAGVNLPLADTSDLPALSDKDKTDIKYGMTMDIDFVAASFVQTAQGVRDIRRYIQDCARELGWDATAPLPKIISKIETAGALAHFDDILAESDGIMVARGDLGVEIPLSQVTCAQKQMVAACNAVGKPVIVATQMVESMTKAPRPTVSSAMTMNGSVVCLFVWWRLKLTVLRDCLCLVP